MYQYIIYVFISPPSLPTRSTYLTHCFMFESKFLHMLHVTCSVCELGTPSGHDDSMTGTLKMSTAPQQCFDVYLSFGEDAT